MGYLASDKGGSMDWEPVPVGTHIARAVTVVDLGLQPTGYGTKEKIYVGFEVYGDECRVKWEKDGKEHNGPALIGSRYTLSIHPKSILGQHLVSWRGKEFTDEERQGFDVFTILGAPCMISVVHVVNKEKNKTYANIAAIMKCPKGTEIPKLEGELVGYSACHPDYSGTIDKLPEWLRNLALEGQRQSTVVEPSPPMPPTGPVDDFDDDIPF